MEMKPLVSIITPTYNSARFIRETINAILAQTYVNWELLVTDDCSTDNTRKILKSYAKQDTRIKLFRMKKNSGGGVARNKSIKKAKGRFIAFCDSDDVWISNKLDKQVDFLTENSLAFTFSSYQKMDETGHKGKFQIPPMKISYDDLLKTCDIGCLTAIYDTKMIGKVYMPKIRKRQDYGLWIKIFKKIGSARGMPDILALYRVRRNSVSSNKLKAAYYHFKVVMDIGKVNFLKAAYYFMFYTFSSIWKYL